MVANSIPSCEATLLLFSGEKPTIELVHGNAHINDALGKSFYKELNHFIVLNPKVKTLVLQQVLGSANDEWNVRSCALIHENSITTELEPTFEIASGGVDLFISGTKRIVPEGVRIGVHSWSNGKKDGSEYPKDSEQHQIFFDMFRQIEFDTAFYWFTLRAAKASDIHWMTQEEIKRFGLATK